MQISSITFGDHLDQVLDKAQKLATSYQDQGAYSKIEGVYQLRQTLENTKVAYNHILGTQLEKVDAKAREILTDLEQLTADVEAKTAKTLEQLAIRAQEIFNRLPFHEDQPRLTGLLPRFILRSDAKPICFKFSGYFKNNFQADLEPQLCFQGIKYKPSKITPYQLEFSLIPNAVFTSEKVPSAEKFTFAEGNLEIPLSSKSTAIYKVTLGAFPTSPGTITKHWTTDSVVTATTTRRVRHLISSEKEHGNDDQIRSRFSAHADSGWTIQSHSIEMHACRGDEPADRNSPACVSADANSVTYEATTRHKTWGCSGHMEFSIVLNQSQKQTVINHHNPAPETLAWGKEIPLNHPEGRWDVTFDAFDGSTPVYCKADTTQSPYLQIVTNETKTGFIIKPLKLSELENI
ncbi:hypothetical protein [Candidatus Protochlamydia amoebophila]|uniref:Uncharacterized protein n=1 Tax=Protochlamydia amoebophila (strain UWE25) TaxID=264201 RepID=Q6MB08_PARUW|nr:hypothetical protein [Candidatus Protochlamydia amoebophila]CAF24241.1 unnamed protein product [Candidatus Protochlamydia amoebophila UWE25]